MSEKIRLTLLQKFFQWGNNLIMTALVPLNHPGRLFRWVFKTPILLYKIGLGRSVPGWILILTTTGRKTKKPRKTPLEFLYRLESNSYWVMAGWAGNTDWYKNARADPEVFVQVGRKRFEALAEPLCEDVVVRYLSETIRLNPAALQIFSRWANHPIEASEAGLRDAARYFPALALRPK
jgi:deazaflavin-dependent oxidoreductase (nitroreductase family)